MNIKCTPAVCATLVTRNLDMEFLARDVILTIRCKTPDEAQELVRQLFDASMDLKPSVNIEVDPQEL